MSETMDRGEFIKNGYTVESCEGGSFIVAQGGIRWKNDGYLSSMRGFSNWRDLVAWLTSEHEVLADAKSTENHAENTT